MRSSARGRWDGQTATSAGGGEHCKRSRARPRAASADAARAGRHDRGQVGHGSKKGRGAARPGKEAPQSSIQRERARTLATPCAPPEPMDTLPNAPYKQTPRIAKLHALLPISPRPADAHAAQERRPPPARATRGHPGRRLALQ
jgi:hypothetical protein